MSNSITGQTFNHTVIVNGKVTTNPKIQIARTPYRLQEHEFIILKESNSLNKITEILLGAAIALFINLLAKLIGNKFDSTIPFDVWELYAALIAFALTLLCMLISFFVPTEKKAIIKKLKQHFAEN